MSEDHSQSRRTPLIERARLYKLGDLQKQRMSLIKKIYKLQQSIDKTIEVNGSLEEATKKASELQKLFQEFMLIHGKCQLHKREEDPKDDEDLVDRVDRDVLSHRKRYYSWLSKQGEVEEKFAVSNLNDGRSSTSAKSASKSESHKSSSKPSKSKSSRASSLMMK